ncbi:ABC transporter ATP-binding protein [Xanthomonas campestris pv. raphani]|uniref:ABC transporter ATP-binding protein n=1 Tax=Xanthomonas campestris TaxID=339 RepID=UPI001E3F1D6E|nr:ABC transporter ATP-binding protein [Xanthomonas campestris]MCC8684272.1 ABC transporter ATP-binding protein/permease [Xanthomonas campestris]MCC8688917.1 ABC transporter ATP-binding protein/permease [Xanthomonas campestris]MCW1999150.1 ATP-binding cassette subfamily B protein [Xanthomonas campestris]MEA9680874.1 ABC transporter ATP-binding protein [Xanthomonas campestris pv. raphani]MEA9700793.1 ABC transporter ATP-binding protein [Xanthomonas campestris pv. raphani]
MSTAAAAQSELLPARPARFLWQYICQRPWHFGGLLVLIIGAAGCAVAVQYGMKLLVDAMSTDQRIQADVWTPLGLFIGLIAVENLFWRLGGWLGCRTVVASVVDIRVDLFRHLTGHPMRYFTEHFAGALGNRITALGTAAGQIYGGLAWKILPPIVDFIGAIVVLFTVDWRMAATLIGFVAVVAAIITGFGIRGRAKHQRFAAQAARVGGELVDAVSNVWTIKAFAARDRESARLAQEIGHEAVAHRRSWMYVEKARVIHDICLSIMAGGMLIWAISAWRSGAVSAGDVVLVSALTFRILHGSRDLALTLVDTTQQLGAIADTLQIILQPHALPDADAPLALAEGDVRFEGVRFAYPDRPAVIEALDLHIPAGQKVGIVGPSGAGKSTLIALIQRLDDVESGRVLIDGQDIRSVSQDSLRDRIAVVPQETALFNRSIADNIRYGRPEASDAEVHTAARHAFCDGFIRELPQGYNTLVGERGVMLSGGQRQRLGIARAFLKDAPILILDEATSALDTESEAEIQSALDHLMRGRTVLAVAHRLSTVIGFDRIVVLQDGRIVEDGSPAELRGRGGVFDSLLQRQAAGFEQPLAEDA